MAWAPIGPQKWTQSFVKLEYDIGVLCRVLQKSFTLNFKINT